MKDINILRAKKYALLSRLLADESRASDIKDYVSFVNQISEDKSEALNSLLEALNKWTEREDADKILRREYAHIFLLPVGVKPFESAYRGKDNLLMQEPWVEVKKQYRKCGLLSNNSYGHPEDHVAVELSFMVHLIGGGTNAALEKNFFEEHVSTWIPQLLQDMSENKYSDFYRCVSEYGLSFLRSEEAYFAGN